MTGWLNKAGIVLAMLGAATAVPARADEEWPYTSYNLEMANKHYGRCDKLIKIGPESYYASCALWAILKGKLPRALDYAKAGMDYYARVEHGERPPRDDDSWNGYSLFMYGEALLLNGRKDEAYLAYLGLPARQLAEDCSKTTMSEDAFITGNKRLARLAQVLTDRDNEAEKALHPEAIGAIDEGWAKYLSKDYAGSLASYQRAAAADRSYCPTVQMIVLSKIELGDNAGVLADLARVPANCGKPYMGLMSQIKGRALAGLDRPEEAIVAFDEAIRLVPHLKWTRTLRDEALERIEARDHPAAYARFVAGRDALNAGKPEAAMAALDDALRQSPGFTLARSYRGLTASTLSNPDEVRAARAREDAEAGFQANPQSLVSAYIAGKVQYDLQWKGGNAPIVAQHYFIMGEARAPGTWDFAKLASAALDAHRTGSPQQQQQSAQDTARWMRERAEREQADNARLLSAPVRGTSAPQGAAEYCSIPANVVSTLSSCIENYNFTHGIRH